MNNNTGVIISNCNFDGNFGDNNAAILFTRSKRIGVRRVFNSSFINNSAKYSSTIELR